MFEPQINFTKWINPLNVGAVLKERDELTPDEQESLDSIRYGYGGKRDNENHDLDLKARNIRFIMGPMGVIPMDEQNYVDSSYNLWNFSTNFDIGLNVSKIIGNELGVEVLKVWTRYRGWIGIGKMFKHDKVFDTIRKSIRSYYNSQEDNKLRGKEAAVYALTNILRKNFDYYSIYESETDELIPFMGKDLEDIKKKEEQFKELYAEKIKTINSFNKRVSKIP